MNERITINDRGGITIPVVLRRAFGLEAGAELIAEETPEGIVLRPVVSDPPHSHRPRRPLSVRGRAHPGGGHPTRRERDASPLHVPCPDGAAPVAVGVCGCQHGLTRGGQVGVAAVAGRITPVPDLVLDARRVVGRVEGADGTPLEGAAVRGERLSSSVFTARDGAFALWLPVRDGGITTRALEVAAEGHRLTLHPVPDDRSPLHIRLDAGLRLEGRIHRADGTPAAGVSLVAALKPRAGESAAAPFHHASTDAAGRFAFAGLAEGLYVIEVATKTDHRWSVEATAGGPPVESVLPAEGLRYRLRLRVLDAGDRTPVTTAEARIASTDGRLPLTARAVGPGILVFPEVPADTYALSVTASGFVRQWQTVTVGQGMDGTLDVLLGTGGLLTGRVHFPPDVNDRHGATVTVLDGAGRRLIASGAVAPDGTHSLAGLPPGPILVRACAAGLGEASARRRPPLTTDRHDALQMADGPQTLDLELRPACRIELRFAFEDASTEAGPRTGGDPVSMVFVFDEQGHLWAEAAIGSHDEGQTIRKDVPTGKYTIEVRRGRDILDRSEVLAPGSITIPLSR